MTATTQACLTRDDIKADPCVWTFTWAGVLVVRGQAFWCKADEVVVYIENAGGRIDTTLQRLARDRAGAVRIAADYLTSENERTRRQLALDEARLAELESELVGPPSCAGDVDREFAAVGPVVTDDDDEGDLDDATPLEHEHGEPVGFVLTDEFRRAADIEAATPIRAGCPDSERA